MDNNNLAPKTNLLNKLTVAEIRDLSFKSPENGERIDYTRLVLGGDINGQFLELEIKVDKKEIALLKAFQNLKQDILAD